MYERLYFTVTDPWEFKDENGFVSFEVVLIDSQEGTYLVRAERRISVDGTEFEKLLVVPRHAGNSFDSLAKDRSIQCNATGIPLDREPTDNLFDLSWWRGDGAMIGTLGTLVPNQSPQGDIGKSDRSDDPDDSQP